MVQPRRDPEQRPSPEALLEAARREHGGAGRLKIFVGAAPGVGKTYEMLQSAHAKLKAGADVVVGVVETHGRAETEALLRGLDVIPRRRIEYKDQVLEEMDLDAVIARHPQIALVDELAHTNVAGSRHPKRYLDVEELLSRGIDVYTIKITDEVTGWLGLNRSTHRGDHYMGINPVVGVRHEPLERLVAELQQWECHPFSPPTVSSPIGYVTPEKRYLEWLFEYGPSLDIELSRMIKAIQIYGFAYMEANSTLDSITNTLRTSRTLTDTMGYRLPTAYLMAGKAEMAEEYIEQRLKELSGATYPAAHHYREFAMRLLERLGTPA